jgi:opacity protein-like surface antigen
MSTRESWNRWGRRATVALAVLALVCPAVAYDTGGAFARGITILGLQIGGGAANNTEGHRTVSDISFLTAAPRVSYLFFPPFGSGLLRSAVAMRYHLIGFGRLVPYFEGTAGAGGTSLRVKEIDSTFTFVPEAGAGLSYFVTDTVALNVGYRYQHISNGHTSNPNRGFNSDSGLGGVSFYFK